MCWESLKGDEEALSDDEKVLKGDGEASEGVEEALQGDVEALKGLLSYKTLKVKTLPEYLLTLPKNATWMLGECLTPLSFPFHMQMSFRRVPSPKILANVRPMYGEYYFTYEY